MKSLKFIVALCTLSFVLPSCKTPLKVLVHVREYHERTESIKFVQTGQKLPDNIIRIGSIEVGEGGWTPAKDCSYEACMNAIETEAKRAGADIVYLVKVVEPGTWKGTCYDITAEFYKYSNNQ